MYAFLLRYLMHFSKHQIQHWRHFRTITMNLFFCAPACFSKYFIKYLMNWMRATMKEPTATEPVWKRKTVAIPGRVKDCDPLAFEKNHKLTVMAIMSCPK